MTEALYRDDAYRRDCEASVAAVDERGIVLDRSVFYPRGGGQAGDAGQIAGPGGNPIALRIVKKSARSRRVVLEFAK
jgi:misacylated tRNA(Ala) deacylase